jgi:hypothetical protein
MAEYMIVAALGAAWIAEMDLPDCESEAPSEEILTRLLDLDIQVEDPQDDPVLAQRVNFASAPGPAGAQFSHASRSGQHIPHHDHTSADRTRSSGTAAVCCQAEDNESLNVGNARATSPYDLIMDNSSIVSWIEAVRRESGVASESLNGRNNKALTEQVQTSSILSAGNIDQAMASHAHETARHSIPSGLDSVDSRAESTSGNLNNSNDHAPAQQDPTPITHPIPIEPPSTGYRAEIAPDNLASLDAEYNPPDDHAAAIRPRIGPIESGMAEAHYLSPNYPAFSNREGLIELEFASYRATPVLPDRQPTQPAPQRSGGRITSYGMRSCLIQTPRYGRPESIMYGMDSIDDYAGRDATFRTVRSVPANSDDEPVSGSDAQYHTGVNVGSPMRHVRFVLPGPDDPLEPARPQYDGDDEEKPSEGTNPFLDGAYYEDSDSDEDTRYIEDIAQSEPDADPFADPGSFLGPNSFNGQ